ncbi:MAG: carbohydrate kinase [Spirochaetales bacterium]|uniref:Carbohydrate kinase n=1 Tax=Candidatus Thalassospirochaeta sargassi TaxID=3119039 RepID=A0AAJ1MLC6_9SPIO|nr:carbohydrate kinase [Spirochaetales bacterium]
MARFFSMGEALIDFIPTDIDTDLKNVSGFSKKPGGAPANVAAAVAKLENEAFFIGKLGSDAFGDYLLETMNGVGINTAHVSRTDEANTCLAFVSLKSDGNREFSFYRKPSADLLLSPEEIDSDWFQSGDIMQFCTVSLPPASPVRDAHRRVIDIVKGKNGVIYFDPNLRFPLWPDRDALKETCLEFMEYADVVKISDEELEFITGTPDEKKAADFLFSKGVKLFIYTEGKDGAKLFTPKVRAAAAGFKVDAIDTTGAGDAFLGGFIGKMMNDGKIIEDIDDAYAAELLEWSNACGAIVSSRQGAISSMPDENEIKAFINKLL